VEFESTTPAFERAKTIHALDSSPTVMGKPQISQGKEKWKVANVFFATLHTPLLFIADINIYL
jgi:hypothetical protein